MPIYMPNEDTFELPPAGTNTGVCVRVVELGTQTGKYGPRRRIAITWELPDEKTDNGSPLTVSRIYTLSANRKSALRIDLENWLGRPLNASELASFDLVSLLERSCTLGIKLDEQLDGRPQAYVVNVMPPAKSVPPKLPTHSAPVAFSLDQPFDYDGFAVLPSWLREKIEMSPEYRDLQRQQTPSRK